MLEDVWRFYLTSDTMLNITSVLPVAGAIVGVEYFFDDVHLLVSSRALHIS